MPNTADRRAMLSCAVLAVLFLQATIFGVLRPGRVDPDAPAAEAAASEAAVQQDVAADNAPSDGPTDSAVAGEAAAAPPAEAPEQAAGEQAAAETEPQQDVAAAEAQPPARPEPLLLANQMVVFYGTPLASGLGILGMFEPRDAALRVKEQAAIYDELNGERGAIGGLDLIYGLVQQEPTSNGNYLRYLGDEHVERYIALAEELDLQIILDLQIGRASTFEEVRRIERFLMHPRVHVAVDPEYAVGPDGIPLITAGRIHGDEINAIQDYLRGLVETHNLPPKIFVVHQYLHHTVVAEEVVRDTPGVDLVMNFDGIGAANEKREKYTAFADKPHARKDAFNIFLKQDTGVMSEQEVLDLAPEPDIVFYQ